MSEFVESVDTDRPAVLLDLDGPLLLMTGPRYPNFRPHPNCPGIWQYSPRHVRWIRQIVERADIHYISGHGGNSHTIYGEPLGLPEFSWIDTTRHGGIDPASRRRAIDELFPRRPVAWVDDDLGFNEVSWGIERDLDEAPTILVSPEPDEGLQLKQMHRVQDWLGQLTLRSA